MSVKETVDGIAMELFELHSTGLYLCNSTDSIVQGFGSRISFYAANLQASFSRLAVELEEIERLVSILKSPTEIVKNRIENSQS